VFHTAEDLTNLMIALETVKGTFCKIQINPINLNSSDQVKAYLLSVGWVPTQWNINKETREQTSPKLTEDSFGSIRDDTGKLLARRSILVARRRLIQNLKDPENKGLLSYVRTDGRIPAGTIPCATNTSRSKHRVCVNIPKNDPKVVYGKEVRALFGTRYPYVQLGVDLSSIEARIAGHYAWEFDNGDYWRMITSVPDIHQHTADAIGTTRNGAKSFRYAITYGATAPKLASLLGCSVEEGQKKLDAFWDLEYGIKACIDSIGKFYRKNG
jgi:DNA polymerase I-like protein with 3'-5' exonuclease and polymerase domains